MVIGSSVFFFLKISRIFLTDIPYVVGLFIVIPSNNYGLSEQLRRCIQERGVRAVFKSDTTLRSHQERPKDPADPNYRIPSECGKVYIGETQRRMWATSQYPATHALLKSTASVVCAPQPVVDETDKKSQLSVKLNCYRCLHYRSRWNE